MEPEDSKRRALFQNWGKRVQTGESRRRVEPEDSRKGTRPQIRGTRVQTGESREKWSQRTPGGDLCPRIGVI